MKKYFYINVEHRISFLLHLSMSLKKSAFGDGNIFPYPVIHAIFCHNEVQSSENGSFIIFIMPEEILVLKYSRSLDFDQQHVNYPP